MSKNKMPVSAFTNEKLFDSAVEDFDNDDDHALYEDDDGEEYDDGVFYQSLDLDDEEGDF